MKTVAMALFPDFLLFDMGGPLEVFSITRFTEHRINPVGAGLARDGGVSVGR